MSQQVSKKRQSKFTSAPIKANMLIPLKSPKTMDTIIITPEMVNIDDNKAMSLKCDQPGVVGEKDNCKESNRWDSVID